MHHKLGGVEVWGATGGKQRGPGCFYCLPTPDSQPASQPEQQQQRQSADWKVLPGVCRLPSSKSPTTHPPPLPPATARQPIRALARGPQVYKQQTVATHQRLPLKDNGLCPPPPPAKSHFFCGDPSSSCSTGTLPPSEHCERR